MKHLLSLATASLLALGAALPAAVQAAPSSAAVPAFQSAAPQHLITTRQVEKKHAKKKKSHHAAHRATR